LTLPVNGGRGIPMTKENEQDEQISPLAHKIIAICREHEPAVLLCAQTAETPTGAHTDADGHADEKMTKHHQEGHDEKNIEHLEVGAELAF
jgi:hypothetical protein